jgi:thiol-disulfide isomerase/thioredoxin
MEVTMDVRLQPWSQRLLAAVLLLHLALAIDSIHDQPRFEGEGRVMAVGEVKRTVTLDHGPIPGLMPAMRMIFPAQQPELLRGLQAGDVVRFSLQPRGPEWVIATIEPTRPQTPPHPVIFSAPDFAIRSLSEETMRLSDRRGKAVLLNFWATWCVPRRTEKPTIRELYQHYRDKGLEVVGVNLDMLSTAGVEAFVKEVTVTFPIVLDPAWSTARAYPVFGLPTSHLIDRQGNVVVREVGERDWMDDVSQLAVERLLREPTAAEGR